MSMISNARRQEACRRTRQRGILLFRIHPSPHNMGQRCSRLFSFRRHLRALFHGRAAAVPAPDDVPEEAIVRAGASNLASPLSLSSSSSTFSSPQRPPRTSCGMPPEMQTLLLSADSGAGGGVATRQELRAKASRTINALGRDFLPREIPTVVPGEENGTWNPQSLSFLCARVVCSEVALEFNHDFQILAFERDSSNAATSMSSSTSATVAVANLSGPTSAMGVGMAMVRGKGKGTAICAAAGSTTVKPWSLSTKSSASSMVPVSEATTSQSLSIEEMEANENDVEEEAPLENPAHLFTELPPPVTDLLFEILMKHNMMSESLLWAFAKCSMKKISLHHIRGVDDSWLIPLSLIEDIRELDLSGCSALTDKGFDHLINSGKMSLLRELNLKKCSRVGDESIAALIECSHHLEKLDLSGCDKIDDATLRAIGSSPGIVELNLSKSNKRLVTAHGSVEGMNCLRSLIHLRTLRMSHISCSEFDAMHSLDFLPLLEVLEVGWCEIGDVELSHISLLPNLRELDISKNLITRGGLNHFSKGRTTLEVLNLQYCDKIRGDMSFLSNFTRLRVLMMNFTGPLNNFPRSWPSIQKLSLEDTGVGDSEFRMMNEWPLLEELNLSDCLEITSTKDLAAIFPNLRSIHLGDTEVTHAGILFLEKMKQLEVIKVPGTELRDPTVHLICRMNLPIRVLNLDSQHFTDHALRPLRAFRQTLERLDLSRARISDAGCAILAAGGFVALSEIHICSGAITNRGVADLCKIPTLERMNIMQNTGVSDESLAEISKSFWRTLKYLNVSQTNISSRGILTNLSCMMALQSLSIFGCSEVTPTAISSLEDSVPTLTHVYM